MHHSHSIAVDTNAKFERDYRAKVQLLLATTPVHRGPAHATTDETMALTHELLYVSEAFDIPQFIGGAQSLFDPNLPWAEDHFQERVGGEPLNPSPSEAWWPFARQGNAEHKVHDAKFSHTYPERFWPRFAEVEEDWHDLMSDNSLEPVARVDARMPREGIRFPYGDLADLIEILKKNINSRQAYLPIWFPEDLTAARMGKRVPCSMGYHFLSRDGELDCVYTMRSCDIVRFYRDDLYMAARLLQLVSAQAQARVGKLIVNIDNLHCFPGDRDFLQAKYGGPLKSEDKRASYNLDALG